jgi:hypothetical protein
MQVHELYTKVATSLHISLQGSSTGSSGCSGCSWTTVAL